VETQVLGLSVDSEPCLKAWAESLGGISYPLLSDFYPHGATAQKYGVLRSEGYTERALFVIDKKGVIRYVDVHDIDEQPENQELFRAICEIDPAQNEIFTQIRLKMDSHSEPEAEIVMYCTPWCEDCPDARKYFNDRGIPFIEVDISRDWEAAGRVRAWAGGMETTPTIKIRDRMFISFNEQEVEAALKKLL
jgi:glutaredoxin